MELWHNSIIDVVFFISDFQNKNAVVLFDCVFVFPILSRKGLEHVIVRRLRPEIFDRKRGDWKKPPFSSENRGGNPCD